MRIALESLRNGAISLNHVPNLFENIREETLRLKNIYIFCCGKQPSYCRKEIVLHFLQLELNVFCINITDLRNTAFKVAELNNFPYTHTYTHTPKEDRYRWKERVLWAHETTSHS